MNRRTRIPAATQSLSSCSPPWRSSQPQHVNAGDGARGGRHAITELTLSAWAELGPPIVDVTQVAYLARAALTHTPAELVRTAGSAEEQRREDLWQKSGKSYMKRLGGDRSTVLCSVPRPKLLSCNLIKGGPAQEVLTWCVTRTRFSSALIQRSATLLYFREKKR